jgi:hypothetical protein
MFIANAGVLEGDAGFARSGSASASFCHPRDFHDRRKKTHAPSCYAELVDVFLRPECAPQLRRTRRHLRLRSVVEIEVATNATIPFVEGLQSLRLRDTPTAQVAGCKATQQMNEAIGQTQGPSKA